MTKRFTSPGAMLAMRAMAGHYFLALGKGETPEGLVDEASVGGYARRPVTVVAKRAMGTNAAPVQFGSFTATAGIHTHAGLYTAEKGGTCVWVGPLVTAVEIVAGGTVTIPAGSLALRIARPEEATVSVVAPTNIALPVISGIPRQGELLTATTGEWSGTSPIQFAFQWRRGTTAITGATAATYTPQAADVGQVLSVLVTATNGGGAAQATAVPTAAVMPALLPPVNTTAPAISGIAQEGEVLTATTGSWTGTTPIQFAFQWQRGASQIAGATAASYTVQSADVDRTLRVIVTATNIAGTVEAASASTAQIIAAPLPGITIVSPTGPLSTSAQLAVSGSYSGTMISATLVWEQNNSAVGQPIAITNFSNGAWTATITTPETAGVYRLRATFNGNGPTATSDDVTIGTSEEMNLATFTFDGSGDGADTVVIFGHSFPAGALYPTSSVVLRRADNNAPLRTQMTPLATWPDGTVKTAAFAAELPALANGALLQVRLRRNEAHPSPGAALTWSSALSGRSILIKTWAPGNTTTPLWTYDVAAALLASSDDWMAGPLAITRRVVTQLPTSAVLNTSNTTPGPPTVRLFVDVTATKDGMLLADWAFCNDRVHVPGGATARFGYTVEIDGVMVHDSRPATGEGRDLYQYSWWWRRRAKKGTKVYNFGTVFRPLFRPDPQVLVDSKYLLPYQFDALPASWEPTIGASIAAEVPANSTNPLWAPGLSRNQGAAGGRSEIGYKTAWQFAWIAQNAAQPRRNAELAAHITAECFAISSNFLRDYEHDRPVMADEWPRFCTYPGSSSPLTTRDLASFFPSGQHRPNDPGNRISSGENAHRGAHYGATALLSGRRLMYDALAFRAANEVGICRFNGVQLSNTGQGWQVNLPDHTTGISWAPPFWLQGSARGIGWLLRDIVEAAYLIPDTFQRSDFYKKNVQAWFASHVNSLPLLATRYAFPVGLHYPQDQAGGRSISWQMSFCIYAVVAAYRMGLHTSLAATLLDNLVTARAAGQSASEEMARTLVGRGHMDFSPGGGGGNGPYQAQNWNDVASITGATSADWATNHGEGDWVRNMFNSNMLLAEYAPSPEQKALMRDALVRFRSFRRAANNRPQIEPQDFQGSPWPATNLIRSDNISHTWNAAPVLATPATMNVPIDAAEGTLIGLVDWTGPIPRCTTDSNASHDAFEIVSQPAGNPFTISRGGAIRRSGTGSLTPGPTTLRVRARTISGNATRGETEVTRWSNTVTVTITVL